MNKTARLSLLCLLALFLLCPPALSEPVWYIFRPEELPDAGFFVGEFTGDVTLTFLGDCTLGGESSMARNRLGFNRTVEQNGYAFPFRDLSRLTAADDLSIANLEGVLTDRKLDKVPKKYNFSGPSAFAEILTAGSIECVTLANNHSHDYGDAGYEDTKAALDARGVAWFGTDYAAFCDLGGVRIGFAGAAFTVSGNAGLRYRAQMEALRELGCAAVITVMHAGTEYSYKPASEQTRIVNRAVDYGSDLIIGHHPHVVQGISSVKGVPVVYSLGNCSFGASTNPKDRDALVVQAVLSFEENELTSITLKLWPISVSSDKNYNNYSPRLLSGREAERVLKKMEKSTGFELPEFDEEQGSAVVFPVSR